MKLIIYSVINVLHITLVTGNSDCVIDNQSLENSWEFQLHNDLKCNYHKLVSPKPYGTIDVNITFKLLSFHFASIENALLLNNWMIMTWYDDRLKWNPSEYDGITETTIKSSGVWLPGLRLKSVADDDDLVEYFFTLCRVRTDGLVMCIPRITYQSNCNTNLTDWFYDTQNCDLDFGAWHRKETKEIFHIKQLDITMDAQDKGREWSITEIKLKTLLNSNLQNRITFTLVRQADILSVVIVHPFIVLSILTITSQFLDIRNSIRLGIINFNLVNHLFFLTRLRWVSPKHSVDFPIIMLYYRGSLIITIILMLITYILNFLCNKKEAPPSWIRSVNSVLESRWRHIVWPRWEFELTGYEEEWKNFANVVNSICIVIIVVVYIALLKSFMPSPHNAS